MKYLIVNGDDFGGGQGINHGIVEAHRHGILTSASLMVDTPWSEEAAHLCRDLPDLSVGLHVNVADPAGKTVGEATDDCKAELHRQIARFQELLGRLPTHLDSHHNAHRNHRLLPYFLKLARQYDLPMREHSPVRYFSKFYGQWGGDSHPEQISVENLVRMIEAEVQDGVTELSCHPGYFDPDLRSVYSAEREVELRTLCDPTVRKFLADHQIQLANFGDLNNLLVGQST
jgi:predicted glycoside hydrolase/deacetylase ChbG (UPF0249 family)